MSIRDTVIRTNCSFVKTIGAGIIRVVSESSLRSGIDTFQAGIFWLFGCIALFIAGARFVCWRNGLNFSWIPEGLPTVFVFFFVVYYLVIGPLCILFCDIVNEIRDGRHRELPKPLRVLLKEFTSRYCSSEYLLCGVIVYCLVYAVLIGYTNLKPAIPVLNTTLYDEILFRWDGRLLHVLSFGGAVSFPRHPLVTQFFDVIYYQMWALTCMTLVCSYRERLTFWRFSAAWCLAFGISIPISVTFPSLGPAFYNPGLFEDINNTVSYVDMQRLLDHYLSFKANPLHTTIISGNGIVAMPSLHIALVYLSVIVLGKYFPGFRFLLWMFLFLFIMATMYLGWHYLSDGIAGILLGKLAYIISSRMFAERVLGRLE